MASPARWNHVWVGSETGILKGVNLHRKRATNYMEVSSLSRAQEVCAMCWGDELESEILLGCRNGTVKVFSPEKGKFTEFRDCSGGNGPFRGLAVHESSLITCVESGLVKVWKEGAPENGNTEINAGPNIAKMRQNPEMRHCIGTGGKENDLKVWDLQRPDEPIFKAKNVRNDWLDLRVPVWVQDLQFLPGSQKIVTCTGYHQVRLYDPCSPQCRPVLEALFQEYPLTALSVTPDANYVVVGNTHGSVAVIDLRQGRLVKCLKGFAGSVRSIQCHASLPLVASCGLDRFLRVHNIEDKQLQYKVFLKSRLNCLLMTGRESWEQEEEEIPSVAQHELKEEEEDEIWSTMETVQDKTGSKHSTEPPPQGCKQCKKPKRIP
ncbi:WD repeat-containing protein 74 isoform X2 [Rhinatrema bivittatum]|uniref:WD repeat-containing protein 74 isoform X2 n=1 Tax=Rhinatrema bivittatum TaxID=194408 RepID=UPI00112E2981|nr:WD repeat-containing protein 74 isoform X2 [Rhinatrema bivittatum]